MSSSFLIIGEPKLIKELECAKFSSMITFPDNSKRELYFKYPLQFSKYVNYEVIDGFLLSLLPYCMRNGFDIKSDSPASDYLLWNIKEILIPSLSRNIATHSKINIIVPPTEIHFDGFAAGTGLSCGVDSFYTILKNLNCHKDNQLNIKYLCYFNAGASGYGDSGFEIYQQRLEIFKKVSHELGCELLSGETNINELYPDQLHEKTHVYRTLGMVLNLQKLFRVYYFSSSFMLEDFKFDDFDPSYHDILSMQTLSTLSTRFILCGAELDRMGKLKFICQNPVVRNNLNVCVRSTTNCGRCNKCVRTMMELYLIGELNNFSKVFDVQYFLKNFRYYVRRTLLDRKGVDMMPIVLELRKRKLISLKDRLFVFFKEHRFNIVFKISRLVSHIFKKK